MPTLALIAGYTVVIIVGLLGLAVALRVFSNNIDFRYLISEKMGNEAPASMSRFQLLIFTFVVAMCVLVLTLESGEFPKVSADILGLLGISGGSYVVSKGIQGERKNGTGASQAADTQSAATGQGGGRR